jgi:hypothetical protein
MPNEVSAEAKLRARIKGDGGFDTSLYLLEDIRRKNAALKRALAAYKACRAA